MDSSFRWNNFNTRKVTTWTIDKTGSDSAAYGELSDYATGQSSATASSPASDTSSTTGSFTLDAGSNVSGVDFDGYDSGRNVLLDSKDWQSYPPLNKDFWHKNTIDEARRQLNAANGVEIEWHFSTHAAAEAVNRLFKEEGIRITAIVTLPRQWR